MKTATEARLSRLEEYTAHRDRRARVFFCTVRDGRKDDDMRSAFADLGEAPGENDLLFLTIYEGRDGTVPDVTPRASVGCGW